MSGPTNTGPVRLSSVPLRVYGCAPVPCPRTLEFATNGCSCNGEIYDEDWVGDLYCCENGFSSNPCPETVQEQSRLEQFFGSSEEDVSEQLVVVELQTWPVLVHRKAEAAFLEAARRIDDMEYRIREPIEGYAWRAVEGSDSLSPHSFGIAVDINPASNPSCGVTDSCHCYNDLVTDMPPEFVQAFKEAGFEWGGDWAGHPDPMHFEWAGWR